MAKRNWTIDSRDYETDSGFRQAVVDELASLENMGHRLGLGFVVAPIRARVNASFVTVGWSFRSELVPALQEPARAEEAPLESEADVIPLVEPEPAEAA